MSVLMYRRYGLHLVGLDIYVYIRFYSFIRWIFKINSEYRILVIHPIISHRKGKCQRREVGGVYELYTG